MAKSPVNLEAPVQYGKAGGSTKYAINMNMISPYALSAMI